MKAHENKKFMQHIFAELERGNSGPFIDAMAEDFSWTITGSTTWSRKYEGKKAVLDELFNALRAVLAPPIITVGERFIADEDDVVVQARGRNKTKDGKAYNNTYCSVFRIAGGKLKELTEYLDGELVTSVLGPPVPVVGTSSRIRGE